MKKLNNLRKRGFTLIEITLVLAVGLGLIVGGLMFFQQAQASSEVTDKTRAIVSISSEVRSQFRTESSFEDLDQDELQTRSGMAEATFNDITVTPGATPFQTFTVAAANLDESVCERLAIADLGPKSTAVCASGTVTVTYTR